VARCSGNRALAARLLGDFVSQTAEDIAAISRAADEGDPDRIAKAAHRLKGAAGNLALYASEEAAAELDKLGRAGNIADAGGLIAALREEAEGVAGMRVLEEAPAEAA